MQNCYGFIFSVKGQLLGVVAARLLDYRSVQEGLGDTTAGHFAARAWLLVCRVVGGRDTGVMKASRSNSYCCRSSAMSSPGNVLLRALM